MSNQSVGIIGCGVSGTSAMLAFNEAKKQGKVVPEIVCYEKQAAFGGLWNASWETGVTAKGEPVHGSMYKHLWSNGPKECLEFPNYTFDEHFGFQIPSYPPYDVLKDYLDGYYKKSEAQKYTKFNHAIKLVEWVEETKKFRIHVRDLESDTMSVVEHDWLIDCSGHFSTPNMVNYPGFNTFPGRILHAHDFREASEFKDKSVLLIGASYSAEDIASQCQKYGAKNVCLNWRSKPTTLSQFEEGDPRWSEKPLLQKVEGKTVTFKDGSTADFDSIILCTGYIHNFPHMKDDLKLKSRNFLWIQNLWKGVVWINNPRLMYIGMQDQFYTYTLFASEAWLVRDIILGKITVPSKEEMVTYDKLWQADFEKIKSDEDAIRFQGRHIVDIAKMTDYPDPKIAECDQLFIDWENNKHAKFGGLKYRDYGHVSPHTGTMAPVPKNSWWENYTDSLKEWLADYKKN